MLLWNAVKLYFKEVPDYSFISLTWHYVETVLICWQDSINPHTIWNDVYRFLNAAVSEYERKQLLRNIFNTTKLNMSVRKMVQAKKVRTVKDYKLPGWISNVLRGEDLLLSVLVVELDNLFLHNLYLKDKEDQ